MSLQVLLQPVQKPSMSDRIFALNKAMIEHINNPQNDPLIRINDRRVSETPGHITMNLITHDLIDQSVALTQELLVCSYNEALIRLLSTGTDLWEKVIAPASFDLEEWDSLALCVTQAMKIAYRLQETEFSATAVFELLMNNELTKLVEGVMSSV